MKILLHDNYDSFTYNLMHLVEKVCGDKPVVKKNDEISCEEAAVFDRIILSPGPGLPSEAGIMPELLKQFYRHRPILGVCLGLQAIAECFGARLKNLDVVHHGLATEIEVTGEDELFEHCPKKFLAGRYHSWVIDESTLPSDLVVTARDDAGNIMAAAHRIFNIKGLQFHPESILSEHGAAILKNWLTGSK